MLAPPRTGARLNMTAAVVYLCLLCRRAPRQTHIPFCVDCCDHLSADADMPEFEPTRDWPREREQAS